MKQTAYQTGDRVVLPPYGVGVIQGRCERPVGGESKAFYQVEFPNTASRAYIPVTSPDATGIRRALANHDLPELLDRLQNSKLDLPAQWSARHRKVTELLATSDPFELAILTCELNRWHKERGLPDLDRQAFRRALKLLEQEVCDLTDAVAYEIQKILTQAIYEITH